MNMFRVAGLAAFGALLLLTGVGAQRGGTPGVTLRDRQREGLERRRHIQRGDRRRWDGRSSGSGTSARSRRSEPRRHRWWTRAAVAVVPGFIDSHVHFMIGGESLEQVNLRGARTRDRSARSAEGVRRQPPERRVDPRRQRLRPADRCGPDRAGAHIALPISFRGTSTACSANASRAARPPA